MRPNCDIDRETTVELYDAYVLDASVLEDISGEQTPSLMSQFQLKG